MGRTYSASDIYGLQQGVDYEFTPPTYGAPGPGYQYGYYTLLNTSGSSSTSQSVDAPLPEPSLVGQAWGRIIPITAGHRTIPGRPIWRKIYHNGDGTWSADAAISFGWRAEMRSGDNDATLAWDRFLANGVVLGNAGAEAVPDITLTFRDGTQVTQDVLDPSEDQPAFIFHMVMYVFTLPLHQFGDVFPDAWDLEVADEVEGFEGISLDRAIRLLYGQTRLLNGKVDIGASIDDTLSALFIVEGGLANQFGRAISRACGLDMRENVDRLEFIRAVDIGAYTVDLSVPDTHLIRPAQGPTVTYTRTAEQRVAATLDFQFVADEATFKFTSRPARRIVSPVETTTSTKADTIRVPLGMPLNTGQTYASLTLFRETEARSKVSYKLPWQYAVDTQVGDVHQVMDGTDLVTVKVVRADRDADRTVSIAAERLHIAQDYVGVADIGTAGGTPLDNSWFYPYSQIVEAVGTASGTGSASAQSDTTGGTGAAAGVGSASATSEITFGGAGAAAGVGSAGGVTPGTVETAGTSAGAGAAAGVATGLADAAGSSSGAGVAAGIAEGVIPAVGAAAGTGAATAESYLTPVISAWKASGAIGRGTTTYQHSSSGGYEGAGFSSIAYSGKYCWEYRITSSGTPDVTVGPAYSAYATNTYLGASNLSMGHAQNGRLIGSNLNRIAANSAMTLGTNEWAMCCIDLVNNRIWIRVNGRDWNNDSSANPATNVGGIALEAGFNDTPWVNPAVASGTANSVVEFNFSGGFFHSIPSGFSKWPQADHFTKRRAWRWNCTAVTTPFVAITEIELRNSGGTDLSIPIGSSGSVSNYAEGSSTFSGWPASKAFDDTTGAQGWSANGAVPQQLIYYAGDGTDLSAVTTIAMTARSDAPATAPTSFTIDILDVDAAAWVTIQTVSGLSAWSAGQTRTFTPGECVGAAAGVGAASGTSSTTFAGGHVLLEDGTSFRLLEDGTSKVDQG